MKKLLLHAFALLTALLPLQMAEAASGPPPVFGGWSPGKTITFRVTSATSFNGVGASVPVPKGVPVFTVGQQVTFTIGKKGELTATGVKIPFGSDAGSANNFNGKKPKKGNAIILKNPTTNDPLSGTLVYPVFSKKSGLVTVTYLLNP